MPARFFHTQCTDRARWGPGSRPKRQKKRDVRRGSIDFYDSRWRMGMAALKPGVAAPDFELPAVTGKQRHTFKLSDLRGKKNVVLAFYPLDWSPT